MSTPVEIVRSAYGAFAQKRFEDLTNLFLEDAEIVYLGPSDLVPFFGAHKGIAGAREMLAKIDQYMDAKLSLTDIVADDTHVVVRLTGEGFARIGGKPFSVETVHFWTVRDGRIAELRVYNDTATLARAVGSIP